MASVRFTTALRERFALLGQSFPGYEQVLTQALFALLTREHILWYSKPGRAKSMVAKAILGMFDGTSLFQKQLTKDTLPDSIFGNLIGKELIDSGVERYNLAGGLADVEFAYLDEFFDASDFVLRAMLSVLNERIFDSKDQPTVYAPLHTAICTTNFMRKREATEAVLDRLLCKAVVAGITDLTDVMRAGRTYLGLRDKVHGLPLLPYEDLLALAEHVELPESDGGIVLSPGMRMLHVVLVQEFERRRLKAALEKWHNDRANQDAVDEPTAEELGIVEVTPRTMVKLHDFSRAAAALNERQEVMFSDHQTLIYGLAVIGDNSGEEALWHDLCSSFLTWTSRQNDSLQTMGDIADQVGRIKAERQHVTTAQLEIGGQWYVATEARVREIIDKLTGVRHPVIDIVRERLKAEIAALSDPSPVGFKLIER